MKTLLKFLVLAAAFGLVPAAATAQPSPTVDAVAAPAPAAVTDTASGNAQAATPAPSPLPDVKATPGMGQPDGKWRFQGQVTQIGQQALWFHNAILMPVIVIISFFVLGLMLWVMFRYRAAAHREPSRTSHNTLIEVIWTVVPVLILVVIAIPSIILLRDQYSFPKADLTVKAIGNQWYWTYQYPDNGDFELVSNMLPDTEAKKQGQPRLLAVDERMVVPAGAVVKMIVTSNDVIHSWGIPSFWVKMDAVPGRLNETWFKVDQPGLYYGQCYELCGDKHGFMPIAVQVVSKEEFAAWVASKGGTLKGAAKPAATEVAANSAPVPTVGAAEGTAATPAPPTAVSATAKPPVTSQASGSTH